MHEDNETKMDNLMGAVTGLWSAVHDLEMGFDTWLAVAQQDGSAVAECSSNAIIDSTMDIVRIASRLRGFNEKLHQQVYKPSRG